jgi:VanZ family protein
LQISRFSPLRFFYGVFALTLIIGVPLLVELGQVAIPNKHPDSTDWVIASIGAACGYLLVIVVRNRMVLSAKAPRVSRRLG